MPRYIHPEWRDSQDGTNYPFAENARMVNDAGQVLASDLLLDAILYPVGNGPGLYLQEVEVGFETVTVRIGLPNGEVLASCTFNPLDPPVSLRLTDIYGRPAGIMVSDQLETFGTWSIGTHVFAPIDTEFAATCSIPTPQLGVRGIQLPDGTILTDDVWLVGGEGVVLSATQVTIAGTEYDTIRVDIVGDPLFRRRLCGESFDNKQYLRQLQFRRDDEVFTCSPDDGGNVRMMAGNHLASYTVLRIRPCAGNRLIIGAVGQRPEGNADIRDDEADLCR